MRYYADESRVSLARNQLFGAVRTVNNGVIPAFLAKVTLPTGSQTNSVTPYAAANAANSCVA
jgi:hypothetical protein